jgi:Probable Zinc-ribbon domain
VIATASCIAPLPRPESISTVDATQWDYATNDPTGITPDNQLSGSNEVVRWFCQRDHGPYDMKIRERANNGRYCKTCSAEDGQAKRRKTLAAAQRKQHELATKGRERLASAEGDLWADHGVADADD